MIVGIGIDLERIDRFRDLLDRWGERFEKKLFTEAERAYCRGRGKPEQHFAARFAAKEAALKLLRPRADEEAVPWSDIEVVRADDGACDLELAGAARALARRRGLSGFSVSLSHEAGLAIAVVTAEIAK